MTTNNTAVAKTDSAPKPVEQLKSILNAESVQAQFKNALDKNSGPFIAGVIDLFSTDTYLQKCQPGKVVAECLKAAVLKLPINKSLGFSYIVPYKDKDGNQQPQFQIGYKGLIQLAMRTGQYKTINADAVYEGELRKVNKLTGEIDFTGEKTSDKIVGYFAYIETINGFAKTLYMSKEDVTAHAKRFSKSYNMKSSAWATDFDAMAKKTVIRNLLSHYGFLSIEMANAIDNDNTADNNSDEIAAHANKKNVDFDLAEEVKDPEPVEATQDQEQQQESEQPKQGPEF